MLYLTINTCPLTIFPGINLSLLPLFFNIMELFNKVSDLINAIAEKKKTGKTIGFVPTMGALHAGHLSLLENAQKENDITVVSIFVNPLQFGASEDLDKYPRTLAADKEKLFSEGVQYLFYPGVEEIYPEGMEVHAKVNVPALSETLCGASRPGHFMPTTLLDSQLATLDPPAPDERHLTADIERSPEDIIAGFLAGLKRMNW